MRRAIALLIHLQNLEATFGGMVRLKGMCFAKNAFFLCLVVSHIVLAEQPAPLGKLIAVGDHKLHLYCTGRGSPTAVIETGLGDFSFDWQLVQKPLSKALRVCNYDRAGYEWSTPGPLPRTFDQLNLELKTLLESAGEKPPFLLVGHSFGGGVVRNFALKYPELTAGLVLVDAIAEDQPVPMGPEVHRIREFATGRAVPESRLEGSPMPAGSVPPAGDLPDDVYANLPPQSQAIHKWAAAQADLRKVEESQKDWSAEYFARWHAHPTAAALGRKPVVVLSRASIGFQDVNGSSAAELERDRLVGQRSQLDLSQNSLMLVSGTEHSMHLAEPEFVIGAIRLTACAVRANRLLVRARWDGCLQ